MLKLPKKQRGKGGAKKNTLGALGSPQNLVNLESNIEIDNMQSSNADINALSPQFACSVPPSAKPASTNGNSAGQLNL